MSLNRNKGPIMWGGFVDGDNRPVVNNQGGISDEGNSIFYYEEVFGRGERLINALKAIDKSQNGSEELEPIYLHIYSYGGDLFTGFNVMNAIQQIKSPVYAVIDGIAASAATLIAMGCDKIFVNKNSQFMIHQLSSVMYGTHEQFKDEMELQNQLMKQITDIYSTKSNLPRQQIEDMLKRDTFISAEDAVRWGFADGIYGGQDTKTGISISFSSVGSMENAVSPATTVENLSTTEKKVMAKVKSVEQTPNTEVEEVEEVEEQAEQVETEAEETEAPVTSLQDRLRAKLEAKASASEEVTNTEEEVVTLLKSVLARLDKMEASMNKIDGRLSDFESATESLIDTIVDVIPANVVKQMKKSEAEIQAEKKVVSSVRTTATTQAKPQSSKSKLAALGAPGVN